MARPLVRVTVFGLNKIKKDLKTFPQKSAVIYGKAVKDAGGTLRDETKRLPAVSAKRTGYGKKGIPVDTGRLAASIKSRQMGLFAVGVFPGVAYGGFVHEGTSRMTPPQAARPFFEWALELGAQKKIDDIFLRASKLVP